MQDVGRASLPPRYTLLQAPTCGVDPHWPRRFVIGQRQRHGWLGIWHNAGDGRGPEPKSGEAWEPWGEAFDR